MLLFLINYSVGFVSTCYSPTVTTSEQKIERFFADLKRLHLSDRDGPSDPYSLAKWQILNQLHDINETMYYKAKTIKEAVEDTGFEVEDFPEQACTSCSESTEHALLMLDGVRKAVVGLALEEAKIHYDPNVTNIDRIVAAVEDAGFGADLVSSGGDSSKIFLKLEGISSPDDFTVIERPLECLEGVNDIDFDMEEHKVTISYEADIIGPRFLIQCIQEAGTYQA